MSDASKSEEFYKKLKAQLADTALWPTAYLYKFIVPTDSDKVSQIEGIFDNLGAVITTKQSKNGKYTSVSVNVRMKNPDHVIIKYKEVAVKVEGVISL
ncbi:DUF493 family protein [uncultured Aquimarina sp.]|uniref:DUF493 family protein n=1 Tax=uncultured Aquimarina sp. TaxID=575652 RepID=UPI0026259903|nr:DUF493 family protein [uncultured Aquimarina sp.]